MSNYCITFRIADRTIGGKSYSDRRDLLIQNARKEDAGYWEETTSFILAESSLHTEPYAKQVCNGLSKEHDLVLVFDPSDMSACCFGAIQHFDVLQTFFPKLKKLP